LIDYDFKITYQSRKIHDKADALTRRPENKSSDENDARNKHMHQTLLFVERLNNKVKEDLVNDLKEKVDDLQLFERAMKLNQENVFCIAIKKIMKTKKHSYEQ
jgi:hypothetical protein